MAGDGGRGSGTPSRRALREQRGMVPSNAGALGRRGGGAVGAARRVVMPYKALRVAWRQVAGRTGAVLAASFFFFSLALANGDCYNEISTSFVGENERERAGRRPAFGKWVCHWARQSRS